jgi:hypothetical protein
MKKFYRLLDGNLVDISDLTPEQRSLLRLVEERASDGIPYTDLVSSLFHPLSPIWDGRPPQVELTRGPLFRVLPDLCARVAIGSAELSQDFVAVSEYARIKGVSRQSVYAAAARGEIRLESEGTAMAVVVDEKSRRWSASLLRQRAGRLGGHGPGPRRRASAR